MEVEQVHLYSGDANNPSTKTTYKKTYMSNGRKFLRMDTRSEDTEVSDTKTIVNPRGYVEAYRYNESDTYSLDGAEEDTVEGLCFICLDRFPFAPFAFWILPILDSIDKRVAPHLLWNVIDIEEKDNVIIWKLQRASYNDWKATIEFHKDMCFAVKHYQILDTRKDGQKIDLTCEYNGSVDDSGVQIPLVSSCKYTHEIFGDNPRMADYRESTIIKITQGAVAESQFDPEAVLGIKIGKSQNYFWFRLTTCILGLIFILIWLYLTARQKDK
ncbi:hypothetical protein FACS1894170_13460 [Planctomycetales bacterium]|nr:hypothetical protein FACS1894170_13460 [Planctomycetales bacterium]